MADKKYDLHESPSQNAQSHTAPPYEEGPLQRENIREIRDALEEQATEAVLSLTEDFHASDMAELLGLLSSEERCNLVEAVGDQFDPETLTYVDDSVRDDVISQLGHVRTAEALVALELDDAVQVLEDIDPSIQQALLDAVPDDTRSELQEGLGYPEESAGRLMRTRFVAVPEFWQVGQVIDYLRDQEAELPEEFYEIIVVDPRYRPVGTVMISRIMQNQRDVTVQELMKDNIHPIPTTMDQEQVAHLFRRYGLIEAPVTSSDGRIAGVITLDDILDVITEEEEEDYLRAGGLMDRDLHAPLIQTVKQRVPWLMVNLVAAALAAWVIAHFEDTIGEWVTLAVLMPVIASLCGNAAIQSVTVSVRAIAMRELQSHNLWSVLRKEVYTNLLNGLCLSAVMMVAIYAFYQDVMLAAIFSLASIGVLFIAGFVGVMIPYILNRLKADPAIASSVFVTALTDMLSFFFFLGLASWLVL
jgi:magnesium transporter